MSPFIFYPAALVALISALSVVLLARPTRALLSLIITMIALSVLYIQLDAPFVAMINLIVYAGAVLVLFLFVIMLQGIGASDARLRDRFHPAFLVGVFFVVSILDAALICLITEPALGTFQLLQGDVKSIGRLLFTRYLLPFELISILLILGILAAVSLAKRETE